MTLGERIVFFRTKKGISQKGLAELIGATPSRLNYWEKDKREPDVKMINRLCEALGVDPSELLSEKTPPPTPSEDDARGEVTREAVVDFLVSSGFIRPGEDLSDRDLEFLSKIVEMIHLWFDNEP